MAATTSMQQHFGLQQTPLRTLNRGNNFLRSSRNAISVKRKSAVELLQETKSLYVKSETVLDRKQELRLSGPLCASLSYQQPCIGAGRYKENKAGSSEGKEVQIPMPPPKSPRLVNLPQRRSTTPAPSCSDQLQNKLRRLLNADSKENLLDDGGQENVQSPVRSFSRCSSHTGDKIKSNQNHCPVHHKSLPDLHTSLSSSSDASDPSDPPSYEYTAYNTCSEKSASKSKSGDAMSLASSNCRQFSISSSSEDSGGDSFSSDDNSNGAYSSAFMVLGSPVKSCTSYGSTSGTDHKYHKLDWNASEKTEETYNWRPILRSKSDVGRRYSRLSAHVDPPSPSTPPDLETFFEQLGLDSADYSLMIGQERSDSSSPVFFSDTSTVDSATLCTLAATQSADTDHNPSSNDLPSIVERNARIIKWLCNCRKAQVQAVNSQTTQRHTTLS